jgi:hypothetical protein
MMEDGTDEDSAYAARMDTWIAWEAEEEAADRIPPGGTAKLFLPVSTCSFLMFLLVFVGGAPAPEALRTVHLWMSVDVGVLRSLFIRFLTALSYGHTFFQVVLHFGSFRPLVLGQSVLWSLTYEAQNQKKRFLVAADCILFGFNFTSREPQLRHPSWREMSTFCFMFSSVKSSNDNA